MKIKWWEWINRVLSSYIEPACRQAGVGSKCRVMPFSKARLWKKGVAVFTALCHLVLVSGISMLITIVAPVPLAWAATEDIKIIREEGTTISGISRVADGTVTVNLGATFANSNLKANQKIVIAGVAGTATSFDTPVDSYFTILTAPSQTQFTYNDSLGFDDGSGYTGVGTAGGHYISLTTWEAGEGGDLVGGDRQETAECYDDWANGLEDAVTIDENTTDATRYMKVTVPQTDRPYKRGFEDA